MFLRTLTAGAAVAVSLAAPQTAVAAGGELGEPLSHAHAHNDYEHERPLLDALEHGLTSIEADVWLVDGELRVAHNSWELVGAPTPEEAYLDPLAELVSPNGKQLNPGYHGSFQLLIDQERRGGDLGRRGEGAGRAQEAHPLLRGRPGRGPCRGSGHQRQPPPGGHAGCRDPVLLLRRTLCRPGLEDGSAAHGAEHRELDQDVHLARYGEMPAAERERLHAPVAQAHDAGYRVRFWVANDIAGPAREKRWTELRAAGVDHINTDDLEGLEEFLSTPAS